MSDEVSRLSDDDDLDEDLDEIDEDLDDEDIVVDEDSEDDAEEEEEEEEEEDEVDESEDDLDDDDADIVVDDDDDEALAELIFEEEAGYADDFDWSSLPDDERARHDELLMASGAELEGVNVKKLGPLERWAVAQAYARGGDRKAFQETCRSLLKARKKHDALMYEDIYLELISDLADDEAFDEAFSWLEKFEKAYPDDAEIAQRVRGLLLIESGNVHDGKALLDELMARADDHGELHLEIGDDLLAMGHPELALRVLARGKDFARKSRDTELMTAIDETRRMALSRIEGED